jgi:hypothetical protein
LPNLNFDDPGLLAIIANIYRITAMVEEEVHMEPRLPVADDERESSTEAQGLVA